VVVQRGQGVPLAVGQVTGITARGGTGEGDHVQVDADQVLRMPLSEALGDPGLDVTALRGVARVAEPGHQVIPRVGDVLRAPSGARWLAAEPEARQ
jgi:hypothetical protein